MAKQREKFCPECGHTAEVGERFCAHCGNSLAGCRESKPIAQRRGAAGGFKGRRKWIGAASVAVAAVFVVSFVIMGMNAGKKKDIKVARNNVLIKDVVSAFDCPCGSCEKRLIDCDCPTAKEENKYIEDAVADGRFSRQEIIRMVAERYGKLIEKKPQG